MKTYTQLFILTLLLTGAISCSTRPFNGTGNASSDNTTSPTPTPPPSTASYTATCNSFSGPLNIVGKMKAYYDSYGAYKSQWMRLRFTSVPTNFDSSDNYYIKIHLMSVSLSGVTKEIVTSFRLEDPVTLGVASNWYDLNGSSSFNRQALFQVTHGTNTNALLNYNLLVQGTDVALGYQIIRVVLENSNGGTTTTPVANADALMPLFDANPNTYVTNHSGYNATGLAYLTQLHPNWSIRNDGWADQNFLAFIQQSCF